MSHGITPTGFSVLVKPDVIEEKTAGGIYLPDKNREKEQYAVQQGKLLDVSPLAFTYEVWPEGARQPKCGDRVMFPKYEAQEVKGADGEKYWLMADKAIIAILEQ